MGMCDHDISLNINEIRALKKLLLSYNLKELDDLFKKEDINRLYYLLKQCNKIEERY